LTPSTVLTEDDQPTEPLPDYISHPGTRTFRCLLTIETATGVGSTPPKALPQNDFFPTTIASTEPPRRGGTIREDAIFGSFDYQEATEFLPDQVLNDWRDGYTGVNLWHRFPHLTHLTCFQDILLQILLMQLREALNFFTNSL